MSHRLLNVCLSLLHTVNKAQKQIGKFLRKKEHLLNVVFGERKCSFAQLADVGMAVSGWRARWWSTSYQQEHLITQNARSYRLARFKWIIRHKITKSNKRFKQLLMCTALKFLHTLERLDSKNNLFSSASALLKGLNIQIQRWKIDWFKSMAGIRSFVALSGERGFCFCKLFHQGWTLFLYVVTSDLVRHSSSSVL